MHTKILSAFLGLAVITLTITGCIIVINGKSIEGSGSLKSGD